MIRHLTGEQATFVEVSGETQSDIFLDLAMLLMSMPEGADVVAMSFHYDAAAGKEMANVAFTSLDDASREALDAMMCE